MAFRVYVFYLNGENRSAEMFSCVAESESEAESQVQRAGYSDYFLAHVRDLEAHEQPEYIDQSIRINPFVGKEWEPVIRAIALTLERDQWLIQTYGLHYSLSPDCSPYVQGMRSDDGSLLVELSGNLVCNPPLSDKQIENLIWVGWIAPDQIPNSGPNFLRVFEPGWTPRMVAERIIETWTSIMNITSADYFSFSDRRRDCDVIEGLGGLERSSTHPFNPDGEIFRIISEANDRLVAKEYRLPIFKDIRGERWVEVFPRILSPLEGFDSTENPQVRHFDDLSQYFDSDEVYQSHLVDERHLINRSKRQMREIWNAAFDASYRNDPLAISDEILPIPPRVGLDDRSRSQTAQAHRIAYALYDYSKCRVRFLLLDRAENVVRLVNTLRNHVAIEDKDFANLTAAAWLSMITQPVALLSYNRRLEPIDLRSWGINDEVINILLALNPTNFEFRKDWIESLDKKPLARYLAIAIELDRVILSEFPTTEIKTRFSNLGKQPGDFEPPFGITQLLRVAHAIEGLATDGATKKWVEEVLSNPRGFWERPVNCRWKSWDEFLFRTGSGQAHNDQFRFALAENPFWLPMIGELFASAESVRNIELFDSGAMNIGLGIACLVAINLIVTESPDGEIDDSVEPGRPGLLEMVKELESLAVRAAEAADQAGYFFVDNENLSSHQILTHLVESGSYALRVLAQKLPSYLWREGSEPMDTFDRKDLIGQLDEGSYFTLFVIATVFEGWKSFNREVGTIKAGTLEKLLMQLDKTILLDPKYFGHRYFEKGKRPSDVWASTYLYPQTAALEKLRNAKQIREQPESLDWDDVDFSPPAFDGLFGLHVFSLTQRDLAQSVEEKNQINQLVPPASLFNALVLSVEGAAHSVVNDRRPCSILIGCTAPGRIEQTVEINASYKRGLLSLELRFCGESIPVEGGKSFVSSFREDPLAPSRVIQTVSLECRENIETVTRSADSIFAELNVFLEEVRAQVADADLDWSSRTINSIVLRQESGGFLEPVLKYFGREIERGVTRMEPFQLPEKLGEDS